MEGIPPFGPRGRKIGSWPNMSARFQPSSWVSTFQGTDSHWAFSKGNTLPLTTRPHGMIGWIPQSDAGNWAFDYRSPTLQGFRATHQPSPWMGDYGNFLVMVGSGPRPPTNLADGESYYPKAETIAQPHFFRTQLVRPGVRVEITPTQRGGCFRLTYKPGENLWLTILPAAGRIQQVDRERRLLLGVSTALAPGAAVPGTFGCHFAATVDTPLLDVGVFPAPGLPPTPDALTEGVWLKLARPADGAVTLRVATSFISSEQALLNLRAELGERSFDDLRDEAEKLWDATLGRVRIEGASEVQRRTFYGCLYRSLLYPRLLDEITADGQPVHRSFFNGEIGAGPLYTDLGLWDAHRSLMPLLSLLAPAELGHVIEGWVNTFREGGWLPSWCSPGYVPCMIGSHAGLVIADAYAKGIRHFDVDTAYRAVRHDATQEPPSAACGRMGLNRFNELGWVPDDEFEHSAARTCDYALADFGAGVFAKALGHTSDAERFFKRALNYRNLFDPGAGFLRGRRADGRWPEEFREFAWSRDYVEGGAWQHTWSAPHDAAGLIALMGGDDAFVAKLERMLSLPPHFELGNYPRTIHEMTEMAAVPFGQYAHCNEPVHHVLHLFTAAGRPDRAQYWLRRVLNELYSPHAFCGDEDNGALGSWYVLNALGLYSLAPGHPAWVLGAPLFERAELRLGDTTQLIISARDQAPDRLFVADVSLNGRRVESLELPHAMLREGGELIFTMTDDAELAARRGRLPRPFSLSTAP